MLRNLLACRGPPTECAAVARAGALWTRSVLRWEPSSSVTPYRRCPASSSATRSASSSSAATGRRRSSSRSRCGTRRRMRGSPARCPWLSRRCGILAVGARSTRSGLWLRRSRRKRAPRMQPVWRGSRIGRRQGMGMRWLRGRRRGEGCCRGTAVGVMCYVRAGRRLRPAGERQND